MQAPVRDTLLRLAEGPELYRPLWSSEIMAEVKRTLGRQFGIAPKRIVHLESQMREHFPDAWVEGYEHLIPTLGNDAKDRHVLAAAMQAKAPFLVSYNLKHFPPSSTLGCGVSVVGPSTFLNTLYSVDPQAVVEVLREQASDIERSFVDLLRVLHKAVPAFVDVVCRDTQTAV